MQKFLVRMAKDLISYCLATPDRCKDTQMEHCLPRHNLLFTWQIKWGLQENYYIDVLDCWNSIFHPHTGNHNVSISLVWVDIRIYIRTVEWVTAPESYVPSTVRVQENIKNGESWVTVVVGVVCFLQNWRHYHLNKVYTNPHTTTV